MQSYSMLYHVLCKGDKNIPKTMNQLMFVKKYNLPQNTEYPVKSVKIQKGTWDLHRLSSLIEL